MATLYPYNAFKLLNGSCGNADAGISKEQHVRNQINLLRESHPGETVSVRCPSQVCTGQM